MKLGQMRQESESGFPLQGVVTLGPFMSHAWTHKGLLQTHLQDGSRLTFSWAFYYNSPDYLVGFFQVFLGFLVIFILLSSINNFKSDVLYNYEWAKRTKFVLAVEYMGSIASTTFKQL